MWFNDSYKFIEVIKEKWNTGIGLIMSIIFIVGGFLTLAYFINITNMDGKITIPELIIALFILISIIFIWVFTNRHPKALKNSIGIMVAFTAENIEEKKRVHSDFINEFKSLFLNTNSSVKFSYIELPEKYHKNLETFEGTLKILTKVKCHFAIIANSKVREIKGEDHHLISMKAMVRHAEVPKEIKENFANEFSRIFPQKIAISKKNDFFEMELTSKWIDVVVKFIIGIAAYLSYDFSFAEEMLSNVSKRLKFIKANLPEIAYLKNRVIVHQIDVYNVLIAIWHEKWRLSRDQNDLDKVEYYNNNLDAIDPGNYRVRCMKAIHYFVKNHDLNKAKHEIELCKGNSDQTWRFSYAFLLAYEGNLKSALNQYQSAFKKKYEEHIPMEIEEFIYWVLEKEPGKVQLYFCLGIINMLGKNDKLQSINDFKLFLNKTSFDHYPNQRLLAHDYINEMEQSLQETA